MAKLLLYKSANNDVLVLETIGEDAGFYMSECGTDLAKWPFDLYAYAQKIGIFVWSGEIPEMEDVTWEGIIERVESLEEFKEFYA